MLFTHCYKKLIGLFSCPAAWLMSDWKTVNNVCSLTSECTLIIKSFLLKVLHATYQTTSKSKWVLNTTVSSEHRINGTCYKSLMSLFSERLLMKSVQSAFTSASSNQSCKTHWGKKILCRIHNRCITSFLLRLIVQVVHRMYSYFGQ